MNYDYGNELTYNIYNDKQTLRNDIEKRLTSNEKVFQDKTTYCRPVLNYYNEQFIYKTMERNARLKRLVRKLAIARQREKETVSWNNFINELKNKHALKNDEVRHTLSVDEPEEYITPEIFNDYYKTRFSCVQSKPCTHLLQEFYDTYEESQPHTYYRQLNESSVQQSQINKYLPHDRNSYCYPTSSQGRLIMVDKERRFRQSSNNWPSHLSNKYLLVNDKACDRKIDKTVNTEMFNDTPNYNTIFSHNRATSFDKMISDQADIQFYPNLMINKYQDKATSKMEQEQSFVKDNNDINMNNEKIQENSNNMKKLSLINIDTKLQTLIESINNFIDEIKINRHKRKKNNDYKNIQYKYTKYTTNNKGEINSLDSDSFDKQKTKRRFDSITTNNSDHKSLNNWSDLHEHLPSSKTSSKKHEIIQGGNVKKSKSVQISKKFKNQPCSVQITFEVPTKDCSTEVTKSLSKQNSYTGNKEADIEEICTLENNFPYQRMTIAVNTDPLSFLSLLRISTDTFKGLLSYMPNIDYYSYLSLLQFPQTTRNIEPHYVCNICGADFNKPSQLSDHIRDHNLGETKDCCVCRHVLDTAKKNPGLFRCQYCGQLFVRAYCCELHQETCARRFGRHHDVTSSLMMLR